MKVFIGGSRHLRRLDDERLLDELNNIIEKNHQVLVGDAAGVDEGVQRYFADNGYGNVVVYHMGDCPRNNHNPDDWEIRRVEDNRARRDYKYFARKDEEMSADADCGFMLWDGESKGTLNNVLNLLEGGKCATVYFSPDQSLTRVSAVEQLDALLEKCNPEMVDYFDKKIKLEKRIRMLSRQADMFGGRRNARAVHAVPG